MNEEKLTINVPYLERKAETFNTETCVVEKAIPVSNCGFVDEAKEMCSRVTSSGSYSEALNIIGEYVEICSEEDMTEDDTMDYEGGISE